MQKMSFPEKLAMKESDETYEIKYLQNLVFAFNVPPTFNI